MNTTNNNNNSRRRSSSLSRRSNVNSQPMNVNSQSMNMNNNVNSPMNMNNSSRPMNVNSQSSLMNMNNVNSLMNMNNNNNTRRMRETESDIILNHVLDGEDEKEEAAAVAAEMNAKTNLNNTSVSKKIINTIIDKIVNDYKHVGFIEFMNKSLHKLQYNINPFRVSPLTDATKNRVLVRIGDLLMKSTLTSLLQGIVLCYKHYMNTQQVFYLLLTGGLLGFFQNEMLNACGVESPTFIKWVIFRIVPRQTLQTGGKQYQWWFFNMVHRTFNLADNADVLNVPYDVDTYNIFEMCYLGQPSGKMKANCVLASMLEAYYFQEVEEVPLHKIFIGLEAPNYLQYLQYKSSTSLRNNNFAPEARHNIEGRYATHWSSKVVEQNGTARIQRKIPEYAMCGPRNLNFVEHGEYIAQSMLYSQIQIMTLRLKNVKYVEGELAATATLHAAAQLHAILFLLLRSQLELTNLNVLLHDYLENTKRDAVFFKAQPLTLATTRRLFKTFFMDIDDDLAKMMNE